MHAYIITGGTAKQRTEKIQTLVEEAVISPFDVTTIIPEPTSIGIERVRSVVSRLSIRPVASPGHAVIIREAQTMTPEAQNAFLKTLEEPPGEAIIFLETNQPDALLPTILSRCQLINLGYTTQYSDEEITTCIDSLTLLGEISVGKRLQKIDTFAKTQPDALAFVNLATHALHKELEDHNLKRTKLLRNVLTARAQILGNITPKLALDAVFL